MPRVKGQKTAYVKPLDQLKAVIRDSERKRAGKEALKMLGVIKRLIGRYEQKYGRG